MMFFLDVGGSTGNRNACRKIHCKTHQLFALVTRVRADEHNTGHGGHITGMWQETRDNKFLARTHAIQDHLPLYVKHSREQHETKRPHNGYAAGNT